MNEVHTCFGYILEGTKTCNNKPKFKIDYFKSYYNVKTFFFNKVD